LWELYTLAFGHLHSTLEFEYPHPAGGGVCFTDPKELRERCEEIAHLAIYSARYAYQVFAGETTIETFNKKVTHANAR
jgi:hypothetical protein